MSPIKSVAHIDATTIGTRGTSRQTLTEKLTLCDQQLLAPDFSNFGAQLLGLAGIQIA